MTKKRKIVLVSLTSVAVLFLFFVGYHYILYLKATSRMEALSADLDKRIAEWEKKEYKRQPLFGPAIKGNAAEFYQEAETKLEDTTSGGWIEVDQALAHPSIPISFQGMAYYEKYKPVIEMVRKGTRAETYKSSANPRDGFWAKIPHLLKAEITANLMAWQARELNNDGQTSEAIKELCDIIQFGDDYLHYGGLIPAMVSFNVAEVGHEEIHRFITSNRLTEPQLSELLGYLKILIDSHPAMQDAWEGEDYAMESGIKKIAELTGFLPRISQPFFRASKNGKTTASDFLFNKTGYIEAWDEYIVIAKERRRISSLPYHQAREEYVNLQNKINQVMNPVSRIIIPNLTSANVRLTEELTVRKGLYILTALQIYKIRHNVYPETLSALAPEIIQEVPLDPFSGQPFIYNLDKDGKMVLYSVGENIKDDNGDRREDLLIAPYLRGQERK